MCVNADDQYRKALKVNCGTGGYLWRGRRGPSETAWSPESYVSPTCRANITGVLSADAPDCRLIVVEPRSVFGAFGDEPAHGVARAKRVNDVAAIELLSSMVHRMDCYITDR